MLEGIQVIFKSDGSGPVLVYQRFEICGTYLMLYAIDDLERQVVQGTVYVCFIDNSPTIRFWASSSGMYYSNSTEIQV
jgi:hypothetical protein